MSDSNIFSGQTPDPEVNNDAAASASNVLNNNNPFADLLGSIKNERGEPKYKDVQTALDALKHSQEFIPQIKTENERLQSELAKIKLEVEKLRTVEQSVAQLTSGQNNQVQQPAPAVSNEDIAKLIDQALYQKESAALQKANTKKVVDQITQSFGTEAEKIFYSKAAELGISVNDMNALAAKSPEAVFQIFGIKAKQQGNMNFQPNVQGSVNTSGNQPQNNSYLNRNSKSVLLGATSEEVLSEQDNAKKLVEELHNQGKTTYDLTDPKVFFKTFA